LSITSASTFEIGTKATMSWNFPATTNIFVPGYLGIIVIRQQQFCCIFAAGKDKFDCFVKEIVSL
jgi:hypothetical protein